MGSSRRNFYFCHLHCKVSQKIFACKLNLNESGQFFYDGSFMGFENPCFTNHTSFIFRFDMTDKRFHGLCSLKYTEYRPPPRMVVAALQEVSVPPDRPFGHLAVVVLPSIGGVVAEMTGKNFINIKEDDERPTCFKVSFKSRYFL